MSPRRLLPVCALVLACSTTGGLPVFEHASVPRGARPGEERSSSVFVQRLRSVRFDLASDRTFQTQHDVLEILDEGGLTDANVRLTFPGDAEIVAFHARTVHPDGTVHPLEPRLVFDDRSTTDDGPGFRVRTFQLPRATVGSRLEYAWTTSRPGIWVNFSDTVASVRPIRHFRFELHASARLQATFKIYGARVTPKVEPWEDHVRLSFDLHDVPARRDEWLAAVPEAVEPFYIVGSGDRSEQRWGEVLEWVAAKIAFDPERRKVDFKALLPPGECGDAACRVGKAWDTTHAKTRYTGFQDQWSMRKHVDVVQGGLAGAYDKARLLYELLAAQGVKAHFALVTRRGTFRFDPTFASWVWFNHLVVQVPPQPGVEQATWLDPSCEWCAVGELAPWSGGSRAALLETSGIDGAVSVAVKLLELPEAPAARTHGVRSRVVFRKQADSHLFDATYTSESFGWSATDTDMAFRTRTDEGWRTSAAELRDQVVGGARLTTYAGGTCDRSAARCARTIGFTGNSLATVTKKRWVFPLHYMPLGWTLRDDGPRTRDVQVFRNEENVHELVVQLPPGCEPDPLPPGVDAPHPAGHATIELAREGDSVRVTRRLRFNAGQYPAKRFEEIRAASRKIMAFERRAISCRFPEAATP